MSEQLRSFLLIVLPVAVLLAISPGLTLTQMDDHARNQFAKGRNNTGQSLDRRMLDALICPFALPPGGAQAYQGRLAPSARQSLWKAASCRPSDVIDDCGVR